METDKDDLPKHLEFILDVVERHARNSFVLKGWSVTLVAAVFLLAVRGAEPALAMAAGLLPSLTFWALDAYYLRQERMFRALYNHVQRRSRTLPTALTSMPARSPARFRAGSARWVPPPCSGSTRLYSQLSSSRWHSFR